MIKLLYKTMTALTITALLFSVGPVQAQRQMETLGRGVVAINQGDGQVYVGWRMLGTDPNDIAFNLYRATGVGPAVKLNDQPITQSTNHVDTDVDLGLSNSYFAKPVLEGQEQQASAVYTLTANAPVQPYITIPLQTPEGYTPNDASVGDLDGDGEYEIVLHQTSRGCDNARSGITGEPIFEVYKLDGTFLWRISLGKNIREGAHYTQFMVYDLDSDGKAEFACKTADGTIDGQGKVIGDADVDYRNSRGYILEGPEYLTIFDGLTGAALVTTDYIPPRHPDTLYPTPQQIEDIWGDDYGNRVDRFLACIAYLDGERPSLIMCRGYYTRTVLAAWNFRDGEFTHLWTFDSDDGTGGNIDYRGQGNHNLSVGDVDGDGKDEIIWRTSDNSELRIFTTTVPTDHRFYTLMHDPVYRLSVAWQNVAYNQPTQPGFYFGEGMTAPPRSDIVLIKTGD